MKRIAALSVIPLLWLGVAAGPDAADDPVEIVEWNVPWENTRPRDPYVDASHRVWFVGQRGDYVGALDPRSGEFWRHELDPGTGPHNLIVDTDGTIWYAGNRSGHIGKLDPRTGEITKFPMPDPAVRDPHTLTFDPNGDIWFTAQGANYVGKFEKRTGKIHLIRVPTERARPYGIAVDSKGRPWINLLGTNKLATVDPATLELREIEIPRPDARSRRIGITADDRIWYVDYAQGYLGRYDPATGEFDEWRIPAGERGRPYAMTVDDKGRAWFVETGVQPNRLVGFDPKTEEFFSITPIPSGGGTVRHMIFYAPSREIWFGTDANTIGKALVP
ncbi:MAG TPA: hypothetical protein VF158_07200 [Longimicrobiales bacterium]